jgi:glycosyltransferase involved in cell wall biosynthesis
MNILIVTAVFNPEPVVSAKLSEDIANNLSLTHDVIVLAPLPTRPFGFKHAKRNVTNDYELVNVESYVCPGSNLLGRMFESLSFGLYCVKYIRRNKQNIDSIYMNSWPIFAQYLTVNAAKKYNIPITTHIQDLYPESLSTKLPYLSFVLNSLILPLDRIVCNKSDKIIAISEKMKVHIANTRLISSSKIAVVQNWQDEENFVGSEILKDVSEHKLFTFMYLGNIGPVAGVDLLLEAFNIAALNKCRLVIAGSGSQKKILQEKVNRMKLNRVEFWDVPNGKVPEIQAQADVMLLPVKSGAAVSSIPSKLPAYMFSKKPIIACIDYDSETARVINVANCGWVLIPENSDMLAEKFRSISAASSDMLVEKGTNGFHYAIENLSKKANLKILVNTII